MKSDEVAPKLVVHETRWPAAMRAATAATYLDVSLSFFRQVIANEVPSFTWLDRGDRYWSREDLDDFVRDRRQAKVLPKRHVA